MIEEKVIPTIEESIDYIEVRLCDEWKLKTKTALTYIDYFPKMDNYNFL